MPLVFVPSNPMPIDEHELRAAYWYAVWDRPIAVPFEHVDDLRRLLTSRWQVAATELSDAPTPGFGIAWRAEPDELLLTPRPPGVPALHTWDPTGHLDPAIAAAWGLQPRCAADEAKRAGGGAASAQREPTSRA